LASPKHRPAQDPEFHWRVRLPAKGELEKDSDRRRNQEAVEDGLGRLDDRERQILVGRYGLGGANELTLERLGRELGITEERMRRIGSRAQKKPRRYARNAIGL
jgi:RNA polymerase primary sigma factor